VGVRGLCKAYHHHYGIHIRVSALLGCALLLDDCVMSVSTDTDQPLTLAYGGYTISHFFIQYIPAGALLDPMEYTE